MSYIFYVDRNYRLEDGLKPLPRNHLLHPQEHFIRRQPFVLNGRTYKLLNVYQKVYQPLERIYLLLEAIKHLFYSMIDSSYFKQVKFNFNLALKGRKIAIIYQEQNSESGRGSRGPIDVTPVPLDPISQPSSQEARKAAKTPTQSTPTPQPLNHPVVNPPISVSAAAPNSLSRKLATTRFSLTLKPPLDHHTLFVNQIEVMLQDTEEGGKNSCGIHAFKNMVAIFGFLDNFFTEGHLLKDSTFYKAFENFIFSFLPENVDRDKNGDVSIATLTQAWEYLISDNPLPAKLTHAEQSLIERVRPFCRNHKNHLSMFNYGSDHLTPNFAEAIDNLSKGIVGVGGIAKSQHSHPYLDNFQTLQNKLLTSEPCWHIFMLGDHYHWNVVIFEKDASNAVRWYGMDSQKNQLHAFGPHIAGLEKAIYNSNFVRQAIISNQAK